MANPRARLFATFSAMTDHVDGNSQLLLVEELAPIFIATWIGPATLPLVAVFQEWTEARVDEAVAAGHPAFLISDASAAGLPSAAVRRAFAEQKLDAATRSYVVITNKVMRGAMTAVAWLMGEELDVVTCRTLADALAQASEATRSCGLTPPSSAAIEAYLNRCQARTAASAS
jgi:hypothetical protein